MSNLEKLVSQLPPDKNQAVKMLMGFKFAPEDKEAGYFEKENETVAPDSLDELFGLELEGKLPPGVYDEFNRIGYQAAGGKGK